MATGQMGNSGSSSSSNMDGTTNTVSNCPGMCHSGIKQSGIMPHHTAHANMGKNMMNQSSMDGAMPSDHMMPM